MYHHMTEVHAHCQPSSFMFAWTDTFVRDSLSTSFQVLEEVAVVNLVFYNVDWSFTNIVSDIREILLIHKFDIIFYYIYKLYYCKINNRLNN